MRALPMVIAGLTMAVSVSPGTAEAPLATPGTIVVEPAGDRGEPPERNDVFTAAVTNALLDAGFLALPTASHSRYLAHVTVVRSTRGLAMSKAGIAKPETHVGDWGAGLNITLPSRKVAVANVVRTQLTVEIVMRNTGRPIWSGSAATVQAEAAGAGTSSATADKLAGAVIRQFPYNVKTPISVP